MQNTAMVHSNIPSNTVSLLSTCVGMLCSDINNNVYALVCFVNLSNRVLIVFFAYRITTGCSFRNAVCVDSDKGMIAFDKAVVIIILHLQFSNFS